MEASSRRIDATRVIGEAFDTYRENFGALIGAGIIVLGIAGLINGLLSQEGGILALIGSIVSLAASVLYVGYVVKLVQDVRDGRRDFSVGDLFSAAAPYIGVLFVIGILFGIGVTIGLILLIIPGLYLITIWAVTAPAAVVENTGIIGSFGRSRELVKGDGWAVFGTIVIAFLIVIVVSFVLTLVGAAIGDAAGAIVLSIVSNVLLMPIYALVSSILFFDLGGGGGGTAAQPAYTEPVA
jgi:hypothetical protein